ncbi:MAG: hypothetical protein JWM74_2876 [Myxococcaceae bacterium]|jgi:hypothetical protein|nr:hypothetical protein [Myxococcaceae bacterium]
MGLDDPSAPSGGTKPPDKPIEVGRLAKRCGSCAKFVRVVEQIDVNGEVRRSGQCLLGIWPSPLYETNTCSQYLLRGTIAPVKKAPVTRTRRAPSSGSSTSTSTHQPTPIVIPEELLDMDADEFREVLREVIRDELGVSNVELGGRWAGGEMVLKPGKEGTQEKRIPIESLFHKIVMIRDRLRVLEAKVNSHSGLSDEDKVQLQQYVTQCYGSLTTFNVLFAEREEGFTGQKGGKED